MNGFSEYPPKDEESKDIGRRLLKLIERIYVRTGGDRVPGSPQYYAEELYKIVSTLRQSKQLHAWPGDEESKTFSEGQEVRLAFFDDAGEAHVSPEPITLPKYPSSFIEGLEAYMAGEEWEKVKEIMAKNPNLKGKEIAEGLMRNIDQARSFKDFKLVVETLGPGLSKNLHADTVFRLERKLQEYVDTQAAQCESVSELKHLHADATAFFQGVKNDAISPLGIFDALDSAAIDLATKLFGSVTNAKDVERTARDFKNYPFSFDELYSDRLASMEADARAKLSFLKALRAAKTSSDLINLKERIETHEFKDSSVAEHVRADLLQRLGNKSKKARS